MAFDRDMLRDLSGGHPKRNSAIGAEQLYRPRRVTQRGWSSQKGRARARS